MPFWADTFLTRWCDRATRSHVEPMKKVASTLRKHQALVLNDFRRKKSDKKEVIEELSNNVKGE